LSNGAIFF
jgi:hypothetical protein